MRSQSWNLLLAIPKVPCCSNGAALSHHRLRTATDAYSGGFRIAFLCIDDGVSVPRHDVIPLTLIGLLPPRAFQMTRCSKPFRRKTRRKAGQKKRENQLSPCITSISVEAAVCQVTIDPFCLKTDDLKKATERRWVCSFRTNN